MLTVDPEREALVLSVGENVAVTPDLPVEETLSLREPLELRDVDRLAEADADTEAVETVVADQDTLELCVNEAL